MALLRRLIDLKTLVSYISLSSFEFIPEAAKCTKILELDSSFFQSWSKSPLSHFILLLLFFLFILEGA